MINRCNQLRLKKRGEHFRRNQIINQNTGRLLNLGRDDHVGQKSRYFGINVLIVQNATDDIVRDKIGLFN